MLTATLRGSLPMLPGAWIGGAELFDDGRALALARMAKHQTCFRWVTPEGWQAPIRWGQDFVGDVCAVDEVTGRMVLGLDGDAQVFDLKTGAYQTTLNAHDERGTYFAHALPHGRLLTEGSDGFRRVWDLRTLTLVTEAHMRPYRRCSAPVGLLPGDPVLVTRSYLREGRWGTALVNAHTFKDVARQHLPSRAPACHSVVARPDSLEWVGVICEGSDRSWRSARIWHFTQSGAKLIDVAPPARRGPGVVSLSFLTPDWLFTSGVRRPHIALNLRTGERRACPLEGPTHPSGLMLCRREIAVFDLNTGVMAPLYPGEAPEEGRRVKAISPDGKTVLVSTPEALEWWSLTR
ncbi:hypothetical protein L6R49_25790 [Myxococcota bacterium]|nr:hypothetical protein [Myxococcota bacterium]